jgi:anti-sigma factor RsiW
MDPPLHLKCSDIVEEMTDFLDGAVQAPLREQIEQHLLYCDGCMTNLEQLRSTIDTARGLRDPGPGTAGDAVRALFRRWRDRRTP